MKDAVTEAIAATLSDIFAAPVDPGRVKLLAGGASKEAWAVDVVLDGGATVKVLVRRAAGGAIYKEALSLKEEYAVLKAARESGVMVPKPFAYVPDVAGREALVMERLEGETIGRRVVKRPELASARARLPIEMAEQLAKIHSIPKEALAFLPGPRQAPAAQALVTQLYEQLDDLDEPHPAIELGLLWLRERAVRDHGIVVVHGDFRVGNLVVNEAGLVGVLDWEFAHFGDPAEDLGWPLVKAWRFGNAGKRLGGIGEVEPFLDHYNRLTGRDIQAEELYFWEILGNVRWAIGALAQARRHLSGQERSVELAILGRLASEVEHEILQLIEG